MPGLGVLCVLAVQPEAFEATLSVEQSGSQNPFVGFVFNATSADDFDAVIVKASGTPGGEEIVDGGDKVALTAASSSSVPAPNAGELNWYRITYDGTKVTVKAQSSNGAPSEASWSSATVYWTEDDTGDPFDHVGGRVGFYARSATGWVDGFTLKADRNGDGDFDDAGETVFYDDFDVDAGGDRDAKPEHDESGNLTYDGVYEYVYDAWNRLVIVKNTHVDSAGDKQVGLATATYEYDGLHRRIVRAITNSADLDCTYHDYYDGQSVIEVRNDSDAVLKQRVWGVTYIDELVQVSVNDDPADGTEDDCETNYFTLHNANYNVQLLVDDTGVVVERYEYTPYGQRQVYISPGDNDLDCHAPTLLPTRVQVSGADQAYGICEIGHQGLCHDEVSGLIYNRARMLHPRFGRFMSRDPLGYPDGMNTYSGYHVMWGTVDPSGEVAWFIVRHLVKELIKRGLSGRGTLRRGRTTIPEQTLRGKIRRQIKPQQRPQTRRSQQPRTKPQRQPQSGNGNSSPQPKPGSQPGPKPGKKPGLRPHPIPNPSPTSDSSDTKGPCQKCADHPIFSLYPHCSDVDHWNLRTEFAIDSLLRELRMDGWQPLAIKPIAPGRPGFHPINPGTHQTWIRDPDLKKSVLQVRCCEDRFMKPTLIRLGHSVGEDPLPDIPDIFTGL